MLCLFPTSQYSARHVDGNPSLHQRKWGLNCGSSVVKHGAGSNIMKPATSRFSFGGTSSDIYLFGLKTKMTNWSVG